MWSHTTTMVHYSAVDYSAGQEYISLGYRVARLGLVEYKVDTFSSDYDDFVDEFGIELDAHGA